MGKKGLLVLSVLMFLSITVIFAGGRADTARPADVPESRYGGTIRIAMGQAPSEFDPTVSSDDASRTINNHILDGLVTHNDNLEVIPILAKSWDVSEDGKTYRFYLREGVNFHKGYGEMTAKDVIASIDRAIAYSPDKSGIGEIEEMIAEDDYTVVMKLKSPTPVLLNRLAVERLKVAIMPKAVIEGVPARRLSDDQIIGTGPYQLKQWDRDRLVVLEKFEDFTPYEDMPMTGYGGNRVAYADELQFILVAEQGARLAGLQTGEFDFSIGLSIDSYDQIVSIRNIEPEIVESGRFATVVFNCVNGLMTDRELRRAVQMAIDCEEMLQSITGEREEFYELNGSQYRRFNVWYTDAGLEYYNQNNIPKAKQIVEDLGYAGQTVTIVVAEATLGYNNAIVLYDTLSRIGLNPRLELIDWPTNLDKFFRDWTGWEISFTGNTSIRTDPMMQYSQYDGTWPYESDEMHEVFYKLANTIDHEERLELNKEMQRLVMTEVPAYYAGLTFTLDGRRSNLKGYKQFATLPRFWNVYKE